MASPRAPGRGLPRLITAAFLVALLASATPAHAVDADSVGKHDWHLAMIGAAKDVYWAPDTDRVVIASDQVVALVDAANKGKLFWRHVLPPTQKYLASAVCDGSRLFTLIGSPLGPVVHVLNANTGLVTAQSVLQLASPTTTSTSTVRCTRTNEVALHIDGTVYTTTLDTDAGTLTSPIAIATSAAAATWTGSQILAVTTRDTEILVNGHAVSGPGTHPILAGCSKNRAVVYQAPDGVRFARIGKDLSVAVPQLAIEGENVEYRAVSGSCFVHVAHRGGRHHQIISLETGTVVAQLPAPPAAPVRRDAKKRLVVADRTGALTLVTPGNDQVATTGPLDPLMRSARLVVPSPSDARALVVGDDDNVRLVDLDAHAVLWTRHEALAHLVSAVIVDFPAAASWEANEEEAAGVVKRWIDRYLAHAAMVADPRTWAALIRGDEDIAEAADFGTRKLLVGVSHRGLVYALDTRGYRTDSRAGDDVEDHLVWVKRPGMDADDAVTRVEIGSPTVGSHPAHLIFHGTKSTMTMNPFDPEVVATGVSITSAVDEVLGEQLRAHGTQGATHVYRVDAAAGIVRGFMAIADDDIVVPIYNVTLDGKVVAFAAPRVGKVASLGRVMGDRSVRYKYLAPHVVTAVTAPKPDRIAIQLVDTVTGRIVAHRTVEGVDSTNFPVHAVRAEHWTAVVYWNAGPTGVAGWTVAVLELFAPDADAATAVLASAMYPARPTVAAATFALPTRDTITALAVTATRNGVAVPDLVFTTSRSVATVSRRFVDALRASVAGDETVVPYGPVLPAEDRAVLSHARHVVADQIVTAHADLESTALVLAYGLDVFWTRVRPSGGFDQLSEGFAKGTLAATCVGLVAATVISRAMLNSKTLREQWL
ncbi:hypothetical protein AMAG_15444 [Allomyces macrogynus ATCC 38327]|uniref:ER membrane protein complex subunit 1 n=1 Tax=Allomyces macrogynus (strain ATCC 38327) TaxID=578462 RepID=A0A0L0T7G1_ALLM3|nr:hypothetical protein AMAG_15444 [Allomyces macrogynus ATCC 38327]|eukprot:KNE70687.1 hypothetical protein AMAG_15444 [Allomyces macrogynus ATCC 38327]